MPKTGEYIPPPELPSNYIGKIKRRVPQATTKEINRMFQRRLFDGLAFDEICNVVSQNIKARRLHD